MTDDRGQRTAKAKDQQKADVRGQMTDGTKNRKKTKNTITKAPFDPAQGRRKDENIRQDEQD